MKKIYFEISAEEVKEFSSQKLTPAQVNKILGFIENDSVLWNNIESSVKAAINHVVDKE